MDWARPCNGWSTRRRSIASDFRDNLGPVNDIIANSAPILDSQVNSGDAIAQWSANLNILAAQSAEQDQALRSGLQQAAAHRSTRSTRCSAMCATSLPQTLANLAIVIDMLKRYNKGLEQALVVLPQGAAIAQAAIDLRERGPGALRPFDQPSRRRA